MSAFDSGKTSLKDLLNEIVDGKLQLPDFQRGWVWDDEHIQSLLISVARSFPIGAVMLLETGGETRFQVRPVEGVSLPNGNEAERLILDGQQRLTSLTQVLKLTTPVTTQDTNKREIKRYYYFDIEKALSGPATRLETMRSRTSAAYRGLYVLVQHNGAEDFFWKARMVDLDRNEKGIDIHHIFPRKWCENAGISPRVFNSIINKTAISLKANRKIGGKAPSLYLQQVQTDKAVQLTDGAMDTILRTHYIEPGYLRSDSFAAFFSARQSALLNLIETAMGKQSIQGGVEPGEQVVEEDEDELEANGHENSVGVAVTA